MAFFNLYLHAAHSLNSSIRKNEPDLVDVKFPSELFFPSKDLLIVVFDSRNLLEDSLSKTSSFLNNQANGKKVKLRSVNAKADCLEQLKLNPDLVILLEQQHAQAQEIQNWIASINPRQKVLSLPKLGSDSNIAAINPESFQNILASLI
ncbi:MAG TPA: hypothetical protein PKC24_07255 [Cyclobacteriaceae bacterium]|nr:hypothetical protein [Cyclobacteriaceae bacterium]